MTDDYTLISGQLNFQNNKHSNEFSVVVIEDGKFMNLLPEHEEILRDMLDNKDDLKLEDMFE